MSKYLEAFVASHPDGWNHEEWLGLLGQLEGAGIPVSDPVAIGRELERLRLTQELERRAISGLGPKRRAAIVEEFETLWTLRHASVDDLARVPTVPRGLAEQVMQAIA